MDNKLTAKMKDTIEKLRLAHYMSHIDTVEYLFVVKVD